MKSSIIADFIIVLSLIVICSIVLSNCSTITVTTNPIIELKPKTNGISIGEYCINGYQYYIWYQSNSGGIAPILDDHGIHIANGNL